MDSKGSDRVLEASEIATALAAHEAGAGSLAAKAVVLALDHPLRVVWANRAATRLLDTDEADDVFAQVFAGRGRDSLAGVVERLSPGAGPKTGRLRLFRGFRSRTVTVTVSRAMLADGQDVVVLAIPLPEAGADSAADIAVPGLRAQDAAEETAPAEVEAPAEAEPAPADAEPTLTASPPPSLDPPLPAADLSPIDEAVAAPVADGIEPSTDAEPEPVATAPTAWIAALGARRFIWQTDADHRLTALADAPPDLAGMAGDPPIGRVLSELVETLGGEPADGLDAVLYTLRPWRGLRLTWPLADGEARVPVTFGAVPIRGPGGSFGGFRGFGVADFSGLAGVPRRFVPPPTTAPDPAAAPHPGAVDPSPPEAPIESNDASLSDGGPAAPMDAPPSDPVPGVDASAVERGRRERSLASGEAVPESLVRPGASPPPAQEPPAGPPPARAAFSGKVVALRPFQVVGGAGAPGQSAQADASAPPTRRRDDVSSQGFDEAARAWSPEAEPVNLSSVEHFNFHEIGRALKGETPLASVPPSEGAALLAALPVATLVAAGGRLVFGNPALFALSGYPTLAVLDAAGGLTHLLGGLDLDAIVDADTDRAFPMVAATGEVRLVEGRAARVEWGGAPALVLTLRPAADAVSQVEGLEELLERRTTEASEARRLLDRVSDAVATVDAQGRLLMLNAAGETLFGMHETGVVGESIGTLLSAESQSAALGAVLAASAVGPDTEPMPLQVSGRRLNGGVLSLTMAPRVMGAGRTGVVFRDLREVEGLRRDLHRLRAELDHGAGARADFLGRVSHEIRTPLNAILGFAEIILDERFGPIGNARYKDYLTDIHAAGQHVIDFVGDLLDLSKMQAGRMELSVAAVDVNRIVSDTVAEMQAQAHRDRVIVRLSLMQHLPNALVDEAALRQIMTNILSNAIAFNEPGGQVIVSTAPTDAGTIAVRVRDTGIGMSETELATVLEPIRQLNIGKPGTGTGLGLPLTHALVEANQATMSIKSRKSEGTLVEIALRSAIDAERSNPAA